MLSRPGSGGNLRLRGLAVAALVCAALPAFAGSFNYTDFSSLAGLQLAGSSQLFENRLRLTDTGYHESGAAWTASRWGVAAGFETTFQFLLTDFGGWPLDWTQPAGRSGADGFAFVIQNVNPTVTGVSDSGVGYMGIPNSLAIEFDTWANFPSLYCEPNDPHVSVHSLGTLANRAEHCPVDVGGGVMLNPALGTALVPVDVSDQLVHTARITYTPGALSVYVDNIFALAVSLNLDSLLDLNQGQAYVGFAGATGGAYENHDIVSWRFAEIPEPGTLLLLAGVLAGVGLVRRGRLRS